MDRAPSDARATRAGQRALGWAAVVVPAVVALALGLQRSLRLPLWRDEYATALFAQLPLGDLMSALAHVDAVTGPYYLLAHATSPVLGHGTGLRALSLAAFALTASVVALVALRWWGPLAAASAGLAFACNGAALTAAVQARPYALAVLFVALAVLTADLAASTGRRRAWIAYAVAASAAVAMHVLALIAVLLTALLLVGRRRPPAGRAPALAWWCGTTAPAVAVAVALLVPGLGQRGQLGWMSDPTFRSALSDLARAAGVSPHREALFDGLALLALAAALAVAILAASRPAEARRAAPAEPAATEIARIRPVVLAGSLAFVPWTLLLGASWLVTPILAERYMTWSALGAALVVAAAVHAAQTARRGLALGAGILAGVLFAGSVALAVERLWDLPPAADDFPAAVGVVERGAAPGDLLVLQQRYYEGGVAYGFAESAADPEQLGDVFDRQPEGGQPPLDVRRITSTDPLRSSADAGAAGVGETVWLVGLVQPLDPGVDATLEPSLAACLADARSSEHDRFGALYVYRIECADAETTDSD
ncbi:hypothetical protein [Agromyces mariniharenae]|uniref:Glycosyltransferase RgtA/B/C/D-like domain-containing protein n=1 Tax=Agromyces mariniharenae TaxID=2604423 RepID=A0A5S4V5E2_9MICO|nr:hypothetical protein [Agromyces mariniharenae]TYL54202.1 hypothetical protein FYC51_11555 [Agromyces mariniharenae]